ncbi:MAG: FAD binding domain-containing protein [Deltaproteobacteria bacterium]|nr:FAD binding domain-containing protein [Deltaproteobacteria bacterium]
MSTFAAPQKLDQALDLLAQEGVRVLAGGTDLMIHLRRASLNGGQLPRTLLDVTGLQELNRLDLEAERPFIGAGLTFSRLAADAGLGRLYPVLAQAATLVGSVQVRHLGTIGGNAANASPAADGVSALTALGAVAEIASQGGLRLSPIEDLIIAPYQTGLEPQELIVGFRLDRLEKDTAQQFTKVGRRQAASQARLNVAAVLDRGLKDPRLVLGSCFPRPGRLAEVEKLIAAGPPGPDLWRAAGRMAARQFVQVCGRRSSAAYKVPAISRVVAAVLNRTWADREGQP